MAQPILLHTDPASSVQALRNAFDDVGGETMHISELALLVQEAASGESGTRIDALAQSIIFMAQSIDEKLEKAIEAAAQLQSSQPR